MKLIFLDIDGVLNDDDFYEKLFLEHDENDPYWSTLDADTFMSVGHINPDKIALLNYIVESTGAKIVISSTWRYRGIEGMTTILSSRGLKADIIGVTPHFAISYQYSTEYDNIGSCPRGIEIDGYIDKNYPTRRDNKTGIRFSELESYVIIDDDADMLYHQRNNFVHTDNEYGLTKEGADIAISILNKSS